MRMIMRLDCETPLHESRSGRLLSEFADSSAPIENFFVPRLSDSLFEMDDDEVELRLHEERMKQRDLIEEQGSR